MKSYYALSNEFGINLTYDSIGWKAHRFDSKKERDEWVDEHCYSDSGNIVAETTDRKTAYKVAGYSSQKQIERFEPEDKSFQFDWGRI